MLNAIDTAFTSLFSRGNAPAGSAPMFLGASTAKGLEVNRDTSLKISAFFRAINIVANTYALLPKTIYKIDGENQNRDLAHPLDYIVHEEPNKMMSASVYDALMIRNYFNGNAIAGIIRNNAGVITALIPWDADNVQVYKRNDELFYVYNQVTYTASEVFHVPFFAKDGVWGQSIIAYAADSIGVSLGAQEYQSSSFNNSGLSTGVIESEKTILKEKKVELQKAFRNAMQVKDPYRVAALDEGMKYKSIRLTSDQVKVIETVATGVADIARWFGIPLSFLATKGEGGYNFLVQMNQQFLQQAVMPIADKFRKEYQRKCLTATERQTHYLHQNYNRLLQSDHKSRSEFYRNLVNIKALSPNEVRKLEGFNPYPGGDEMLQMVNMHTESQVEADLNKARNEE